MPRDALGSATNADADADEERPQQAAMMQNRASAVLSFAPLPKPNSARMFFHGRKHQLRSIPPRFAADFAMAKFLNIVSSRYFCDRVAADSHLWAHHAAPLFASNVERQPSRHNNFAGSG
jgi:hypothetical protein